MRSRYWLRFESGERSGEEVSIPAAGLTVGRRPPEGGLVLSEASVSGRHARILVEDEGLRVLDLGSTNGTRVDGESIEEALVRPGSVVAFGKVRLLLGVGAAQDPAPAVEEPVSADPPEGELALEEAGSGLVIEGLDDPAPVPARAVPAAAPAARAPAAPTAEFTAPELGDAGDGELSALSQERMQRSKGGSKVMGAAVLALLGAGGFLGWQALTGGVEEGSSAFVAVATVAGDLVKTGSFEGDGGGWENDPAAAGSFYLDAAWSATGAAGFGADLLPGEWARARSPELRVPPRQSVQLTAEAAVSGAAAGRVGLELFRAGDPVAVTTAWSKLVTPRGGASSESLALAVNVPPAFDAGRIVVAGFTESGAADAVGGDASTFSVDDVHLVAGGAQGAGADFGDHRFDVYSDSGLLSRVDRVLLADARFVGRAAAPRGGSGALVDAANAGELSVVATERGFRLATSLTGATRFELRADAALVEAGVATTGTGGYRSQSYDFTSEGVESVLLGDGLGLVRLVFSAGCALRARPHSSGGLALRADLPAGADVELQLSFLSDRGEAVRLAESARTAEREGRMGDCFDHWSELLDRYPFESSLVSDAQQARARLLAAGADEVAGIRRELERARFFELADLYRECIDAAEGVSARYGSSEVGAAAAELAAAAEAEWAALGGAQDRRQASLALIVDVLRESESKQLAEYIVERAAASATEASGDGAEAEGR